MAAPSDQSSMNQLLQWGIQNSETSREQQPAPRDPSKGLNSKMLAQLLGGPSDADLMREAMRVVTLPLDEAPLESKLIAWDNLEQLVEQIDNANNIEPLGLWPPLLARLQDDEAECRTYAAWVISTAVQNNIKSQEKFFSLGGIDMLLKLVLNDSDRATRKKAATALSSSVRNYQPALDDLMQKVPAEFAPQGRKLDACEMEEVNGIIDLLRQRAAA